MDDPVSANLRPLSPELDGLLRAKAKLFRLSRAEALYHRGSMPDALFYVDSGLIRLSVAAANGREAVMSIVSPGYWFGETSLFIDEPRIHDAVALVDTRLFVVSAAAFHDVVDENPGYLREFLRLICSRYKQTLERLDATSLLPLSVRLARHLLSSQAHRTPTKAETVVTVSQETIAQILGVSRQSINRMLRLWEADGIVNLSYRAIIINDLISMQALAEEPID